MCPLYVGIIEEHTLNNCFQKLWATMKQRNEAHITISGRDLIVNFAFSYKWVHAIRNSTSIFKILESVGVGKRSSHGKGGETLELSFQKDKVQWQNLESQNRRLTTAIIHNMTYHLQKGRQAMLKTKRRRRDRPLGMIGTGDEILTPQTPSLRKGTHQPTSPLSVPSTITPSSSSSYFEMDDEQEVLMRALEILHDSVEGLRVDSNQKFGQVSMVEGFISEDLEGEERMREIGELMESSTIHSFLTELLMSKSFRER